MRLVDLLMTISHYPLQDQSWGDEVLKFVNIELPSDQQLTMAATGDQVLTHLRQALGYDESNRVLETQLEHKGAKVVFISKTVADALPEIIAGAPIEPIRTNPQVIMSEGNVRKKTSKVVDWVMPMIAVFFAIIGLILLFTTTYNRDELDDPETQGVVRNSVTVLIEFLKFLNNTPSPDAYEPTPPPYPERTYDPPPMRCTEETMGYAECQTHTPRSDGLGL